MMRSKAMLGLLGLLLTGASQAQEHGQMRMEAPQAPLVWDAGQRDWLSVETFWAVYAQGGAGFHWGRGATYPAYEQVKEFDTFIVEVAQGPCLMEFFHQRWRRANDVRRWDDRMNAYGGCAHVFADH